MSCHHCWLSADENRSRNTCLAIVFLRGQQACLSIVRATGHNSHSHPLNDSFDVDATRHQLGSSSQRFRQGLSNPVGSLFHRVMVDMGINHGRAHVGVPEDCPGHGECLSA